MDNIERDEKTIDLKTLLFCLLDRVWLIVIVSLICAASVGIYTKIGIDKEYTSAAKMYVQNKDTADKDSAISSSDITAAASLVQSCQDIFTSDMMIEILQNSLAKAGYIYSNEAIKEMITISSPNNTPVMVVSAVSGDPNVSQIVANTIVTNADNVYSEIVQVGSVRVITSATYPEGPSSPNLKKNMLLGFAAGFVLICAVVILMEICDTKIKPQDNLMELYGVPLIAEIMDFDAEVK